MKPKQPIASYLDQLQLDPKLRLSLIAGYLTNIRLVLLAVVSIIILGIASFVLLPRRLNPEVQIPLVLVSTALPGASPEDVEQLVTIPLEKEIKNADKLDVMMSTSQENVSIIQAQFLSSVSVKEARDEVQRLVDTVQDLPDDALTPSVQTLDFEDVAVWSFALTSSDGRAALEAISQDLVNEIETLSSVDRVEVSGIESRHIQILLEPTKLLDLGISPMAVSGAIRAATKSLPAGSTVTDTTDFSVSIDPTVTTVDELRELPLNVQGNVVVLGEVAQVELRSEPYQTRSYLVHSGGELRDAVRLDIYKTSEADISATQQTVASFVNDYLTDIDSIELTSLENVAQDIDDQFRELFSNFASTIALVFITLFVFLGVRQAAIASLSIPLTFLVSFTIMNLTGQSLNFLTMFSLLLGLGLLVDDAIVIISAMTAYHKTGKFTAQETGLLVWRDYIIPIWTTTITTVWAFLPLLLASGIIGEFIKPIPIVVSATLLTSTSVAVLITLPLMMVLLRLTLPKRVVRAMQLTLILAVLALIGALSWQQPLGIAIVVLSLVWLALVWRWKQTLWRRIQTWATNGSVSAARERVERAARRGIIDMTPVADRYQTFIRRVLQSQQARRQVLLGVVIFSLFSYALVPLGFVKNEFFPKSEADVMYVGLELPTGSSLHQTEPLTKELLQELAAIPEVEVAQADVGRAPMSADMSVSNGGNHTANITLRLQPDTDRVRSVHAIADEIRDRYQSWRDRATVSVLVLSGGPPAGSDLNLKIVGPELSELESIADQVESYLKEQGGVTDINRSMKPSPSKIVFVPNQPRLAELGLTNQDVGFWLRTGLSGFELGEVTLPHESEADTINLKLGTRPLTPEELTTLTVPTSSGPVPVSSLGTLRLQSSPSVIQREDGQRTLTVTAGIEAGYSIPEKNADALAYAQSLDLPAGYSFDTGGVNEENQKSIQSILQAMIISVLLILITMVIQLGSFRQAVLVILVIPLAVSGVFIVSALTGTPLSFPALIGVLALFGIVVNNSIMLVDKINQNIKTGMKQLDAISDAASSRLEPILFSSLTTITGLVPITVTDPLWRGLGGAIISGLFLSGAIMLLFIPVLYQMWYPENAATRARSK